MLPSLFWVIHVARGSPKNFLKTLLLKRMSEGLSQHLQATACRAFSKMQKGGGSTGLRCCRERGIAGGIQNKHELFKQGVR